MERTMIATGILVAATGCQSDSDRIAELASRHATEQSQLTRETIELQAELVEGTQQLVAADAQARRDFIELEGKLDEQRAEIEQRHDALEDERRDIAKHRYRAPVVANAVITVGPLLACLLPLVLAGYLLRCQLSEPDDHSLTEVLLHEIAAGHPAFASPDDPLLAQGSSRSAMRIGGDVEQRPLDDLDQPTHAPD